MTTTTSLPSIKVIVADAPETTNFKSEFVYNFFTPDERTSVLQTNLPAFIKNRTTSDFDDSFIDTNNFNRFVPRYVKLTWTPKILSNDANALQIANKYSIKDNLNNVYSETSFAIEDFSSISLQDENIEEKLDFFIKRMLDESRKRLPENKKSESPLDMMKFLKRRTSNKVKDKLLTEAFSKFKKEGQIFRDPITKREKFVETSVDRFNQIKPHIQLNNKFINKIIKTSTESTMHVYNDQFAAVLENTAQIEQNAIANSPASLIDAQDYDLEVSNPVDIKAVDANGYKPEIFVVGYIIRKTEIDENGNIVQHNPIIVENPFVDTTIDLQVRYGTTYQYTIETVVLLSVQAEDMENNQVVSISFLMSSKPSSTQTVECNEYLPPEPPSDFSIQWDYIQNHPRLSWGFPVNSQRDVKYFQIFRRKNIDEPFELIKMYDFDDSLVLSPFNETPDERLIETLTNPKCFFFDREFNRDLNSMFIYTVCCVDAHGYSSNYGPQYKVWFNRFENKLKHEFISKSGAPKAYPNLYLEQDMFVDSIRDSGHKEVKIYFTPEYLNVLDKNGIDLGLIKENGLFQFQMINVDLQEQQVFNIDIEDLRTTTTKTE